MKRIILSIMLLAVASVSYAGPLDETRICTVSPARDADGSITRRADVLAAFKRIHPCPSTGKSSGACPGFAIDHTIPLKCGGCDHVVNLSYLPNVLKSGPGKLPKDRWERLVNCSPRVLVQMPVGRYRIKLIPIK